MSAQLIAFAHWLDACSIWAWFAFLTIPFWFLALAGKLSKRPTPAPAWMMAVGGLGFIGSIAAILAIQNFIARAAWAEIKPRLISPTFMIEIDGTPTTSLEPVVDALRAQHELPAEHSSPLQKHHLVLQTQAGLLRLDIARDSADPKEFWVWNPDFQTTTEMAGLRASSAVLPPG